MTARERRALQRRLERATAAKAKAGRERDAAILADVAAGKTERWIAAEFGVSPTVVQKVKAKARAAASASADGA